MISDVLSEACHQIREYLENPVYNNMYSGKLRDEIERVVGEMDRLRANLDRPPATLSSSNEQRERGNAAHDAAARDG